MTNATCLISDSKFVTNSSIADIVPPVASRSSIIATLELSPMNLYAFENNHYHIPIGIQFQRF